MDRFWRTKAVADALAFAAYNAGGGRVAQWIAAHGDPRTGSVDLVDWIEQIPYDETRDYVERVSENLSVYRQRLADEPPTRRPSRCCWPATR